MANNCVVQSLSQQASFYGYSEAEPGQPRKLGWVTLRTRYLDDALLEAFSHYQGKPCQAVLLGAGMDARPWRLRSISSVRCVALKRKLFVCILVAAICILV